MAWTKKLEKLLKKTALRLFRVFYRPDPSSGEIHPLEIHRILVVRPDNRIGNLILITPLLQMIRNAFPKAHVALLTGRSFPTLLSGHPALDEILVADQRRFIRNPFYLLRFFHRLKRSSFDLAVDASHMHSLSFTAGVLARATGAPIRLGYDRPHSDLFLNVRVPLVSGEPHEIDIHLNLVRVLIGDTEREPLALPSWRRETGDGDNTSHVPLLKAPPLYLPVASTHRHYAEQVFAKYTNPYRMSVGLHLGGRRGKQWPPECFAVLMDRLVEDFNVQPVVFWGEGDQRAAKEVQHMVKCTPLWIPPGPVERLPALIAQCSTFISSDTGPMHMAVALGIPTIAIFAVENYRRYGPRGPRHRIVFRKGGPEVKDVLHAFEDLLCYLNGSPEYRGTVSMMDLENVERET